MDRSLLQRLAESGLTAFPPANLDELATWCQEYCWATGHVAYCILSDLFGILFDAWSGPILDSTSAAMSAALGRDIPAILAAEHETARVVALAMRDEVLQILSFQRVRGSRDE